jgi:septum formation protein
VDETERHGESPRARAFRLSEAKAEAVAAQFPQAIVVGGDQVPATSTTILNKPGNAANCREQLKLLSGSTAEFYTACTVRCLETGVKLSHVDTTAVKLRRWRDSEIDHRYHRARKPRLLRALQGPRRSASCCSGASTPRIRQRIIGLHSSGCWPGALPCGRVRRP